MDPIKQAVYIIVLIVTLCVFLFRFRLNILSFFNKAGYFRFVLLRRNGIMIDPIMARPKGSRFKFEGLPYDIIPGTAVSRKGLDAYFFYEHKITSEDLANKAREMEKLTPEEKEKALKELPELKNYSQDITFKDYKAALDNRIIESNNSVEVGQLFVGKGFDLATQWWIPAIVIVIALVIWYFYQKSQGAA